MEKACAAGCLMLPLVSPQMVCDFLVVHLGLWQARHELIEA